MPFEPVYNYADLVKRNRPNAKVPGFNFDVDTFENLIDSFVPQDRIPIILSCGLTDLDKFCNKVYGMTFKETYTMLSGISDMWMRRAIVNLSHSGNSTALNIASKHFMGLSDEAKDANINITFVNDLEEDD